MTTADTTSRIRTAVGTASLPDCIQAEVLSVITHATGTEHVEVVVWGPADPTCPSCGQSERPTVRACPVSLNPSMGEVQVWDQQHGCGQWWGPPWEIVPTGDLDLDDPADIETLVERLHVTATELASDVTDERQRQADAIRRRLTAELRLALAALAEGADPDDVRTGSDMAPGVWPGYGDETWEAWDFDPRDPWTPEHEGSTITVTADDLDDPPTATNNDSDEEQATREGAGEDLALEDVDDRWRVYKKACRMAAVEPLSWGAWLRAGQPLPEGAE